MARQPRELTSRSVLKLPDHEAFKLLERYNIPCPPYGLAKTPEEAAELAETIGYPVVMKIVSPDVSHKTDVGGVVIGVKSREEAVESFKQILKNVKTRLPNARVEGILVQKMVPRGVEVIIGGIRDSVFGVVVMFGLGGVLTEVLRDVTFRIWPFTLSDARDMISEIRGVELLKGYRGLPPASIDSIAEVIFKLGKLLEDNPMIETADLNPVIAYPDKCLVVDVRFILKQV